MALVTGGGRGIGRATALALAQAGADVMAVSRTTEELATLEHPRICTFGTSLATRDGCSAAVNETLRRLGPVDVLVSNAGLGSSAERPVWEQEPDTWYTSMAINLHAAFELIRLSSSGMVSRGWGRIVVVSSTAGLVGEPSQTAYVAAKHGVIGLVRGAALDLAPHSVTCNAVCPGWVRTEMAETSARADAERENITPAEVWEQRARSYAAGRIVATGEVVSAIMFLVSPAASGVSGEAIKVALGDAL
ncbi:MAG: SDR family oxidoreductase [Actinomycetota bacterium]|nr:SDR family oxidoreductase [Actinomycetota bacterium]